MTTPDPVQVLFVCWGNICRSPMAERVARATAEREGLEGVEFASFGVSSEELGNPIDPRARRTLTDAGFDADDHEARQIGAGDVDGADLVVSMDDLHTSRMLRLRPERTDHIRLLTSFDPDAEPGSAVPDPWYGEQDGFSDTLAAIEGAMPGILDEVRRIQADRRG